MELLINNLSVLFLALVILLVYYMYSSRSRDTFIIAITVLEHIIEVYYAAIFSKKKELLARQHDLNPESKVNAIVSYQKKVNELTVESVSEVVKLLTSEHMRTLRIYFSYKSLALFITNKLKALS